VWDSPKLGLGQQFSFTFNEAGEFQYFCIPHPTFMVATITVVEAGSSNAPLLSGS
jgi:plastocyanin